jgi:hypothetical protein
MTGLDLVTLAAGPIVKHENLVALALLDDGRLDFGAADRRPAHLDLVAIGHEQDVLQLDRLAHLLRQLLDANFVTHARAELLSTDLKDCVHDDTPNAIAPPLRGALLRLTDKQKRPDLPGRWRVRIITGLISFVKRNRPV